MNRIFSQSKKELEDKIKFYIENDSEIDEYHKKSLSKWNEWFYSNYDKIELCNLQNNMFYRAYFEEPDIYGIQLWEDEGEYYVWNTNLYVNKDLEENGEDTVIIT